MAEPKTQKTNASVKDFLMKVKPDQKRADALELLKIFEEVTGEKPAMWGTAIIGFGSYHYKSERSRQEGDWPRTGFSPRKTSLTVYLMSGLTRYEELLKKLGKHKISGGSCLYINRLSDINVVVLKKLISASLKEMEKRYPLL